MTLQMLEYFVAVARRQNFTHAAQDCHVTQPALSRAIQGLEEELGCMLLVRTGRTATLTAEGEVCLVEAQRLLRQKEELILRVREAELKNSRPLRMGYVIATHLNTFLQVTGGSLPFGMESLYGTVEETKARLTARQVDAILLPEPCVGDLSNVERKLVQKSGIYAIVHKANPLSGRESLKMAELKDQSFIMWSKKDVPLLYARHVQACREAGFAPRVVGEAEKLGDLIVQVTLHNGVGLTSKSPSKSFSGDCRFIPVPDTPQRFGVVCVWRKGDNTTQVQKLEDLLNGLKEETIK